MSTNSIKRSYIFGHLLQSKLHISNARKLNRVMIKSNALGVRMHLQVRKEWAFEVGIVDGSSCGTGENSSGCLLFFSFFPYPIHPLFIYKCGHTSRHIGVPWNHICLVAVWSCRSRRSLSSQKEFVQTDSQNHALTFLACIRCHYGDTRYFVLNGRFPTRMFILFSSVKLFFFCFWT